MYVRLALETDEDAVVEMALMNYKETVVTPTFDPGFSHERVREVFRSYISDCSCTIWVVDERRAVLGFLLATMNSYRFTDGLYTTQEVMFVKPENRGTRAAVLLTKELVRWSAMLGAKEITGGNDNGFQSDRTARFLQHFGFEQVGHFMRRVM